MLTPTEQEELRARFNPDGSPLRIAQLQMVKVLRYIDCICRENHILYWLDSGTLLGAVRHGGFIPWDDDIDIGMLRKDAMKFKRIMLKQSENKDFILHCKKTDAHYWKDWFVIRDLYTEYIQDDVIHNLQKYKGLQVDIFPFDRGTIKALKRFSCFLSRVKYRMLRTRHFVIANIIYGLSSKMLYPFFRFLGSIFSSSDILSHTYGVPFLHNRRYKDVFPLKELVFEGYPFYVPGNYDAYLRDVYGADYMSVPAADKIKTHNVKFKSLK